MNLKDLEKQSLNKEFSDISSDPVPKDDKYSGRTRLGVLGGGLVAVYGSIAGIAMTATQTTPVEASYMAVNAVRIVVCAPILKNPRCG